MSLTNLIGMKLGEAEEILNEVYPSKTISIKKYYAPRHSDITVSYLTERVVRQKEINDHHVELLVSSFYEVPENP